MSITITVSRQLGAGGTQIASRLSGLLGLRLVDRQILDRVAEEAGVSTGTVEAVDESPAAVKQRPKGAVARAGEQTYDELIRRAIEEYARLGDVVIVGRGAHMLLAGRPGLLRVKILAPREARVLSLMQRLNLSRVAAERAVRDSDRNRAGFVRAIYKVDWMDATLYDLVLNTRVLDYETGAEAIAHVAKRLQIRSREAP